MAKLTIGDKAHRVLRFLMGVRNRRASRVLERHGFDQEELERGWTLLRNLSSGRLGSQASVLDPALIGALDVWENRWFPIADASLTARAPAARELVFRNLTRTEGPAVVISVGTFLERLEALPRAAADGGLGEEGESARELLARRGLTEDVVAEARRLLDKVGRIEPTEEPEPEDQEAHEAAERELWTWYLEWSAIARVAISDRRMLRSLGFLRYKSQASGADESDDPEPEDPDPEDVVEPSTDEPAPAPN